MDNFIRYVSGEPTYSVLVDCAIQHYQFEAVHPFEDGNGRVGRLLIPLHLLAQGAIERPNLYLSAYFVEHEDEYFDLLKGVSTRGLWEEWIVLFLEAIRVTAGRSRQRVRRLLELGDIYRLRVREATRSQVALAAIDLIVRQPVVTTSQVKDHAKSSYPAAKTAMESLANLGIVNRLDSRMYRQQAWVAGQLIDEIYDV